MDGEVIHTLHHKVCPVIMICPVITLCPVIMLCPVICAKALSSSQSSQHDLCCKWAGESQQMTRLVSAMMGMCCDRQTQARTCWAAAETDRETNRETDRETERQTERQTDSNPCMPPHKRIQSLNLLDKQHRVSPRVMYTWTSAAASMGAWRQMHPQTSPSTDAAMHSSSRRRR